MPQTAVTTGAVFLILSSLLVAVDCTGSEADKLASLLKTYFRCKPCNPLDCPALPLDCEPVRETGICACCMTCALTLGEACGARTEKCGVGLQCRPLPSETLTPLETLLAGRGICQRARKGSPKFGPPLKRIATRFWRRSTRSDMLAYHL